MKYKKSEEIGSLEELELGKIRLVDNGMDPENIWIKTLSENKVVLQNHALNFHPFPSWGAILEIQNGSSNIDVSEQIRKMEIDLHPEAWEQYLSKGWIDEQGNYLNPNT